MAPRFGGIKFNLLRAIEMFEDMNHEDMDVAAPPSGPDFFKEREVAQLLNDYLLQLIDDGTFDNCDLREVLSSEDDEYNDKDDDTNESSTPESQGFNVATNRSGKSDERASRESLTDKFKRYVRRILPGRKSSRATSGSNEGSARRPADDEDDHEDGVEDNYGTETETSLSVTRRSGLDGSSSSSRRFVSRSTSNDGEDDDELDSRPSSQRSRPSSARLDRSPISASEPYDPKVAYSDLHRHRHHHHHHQHEHGASAHQPGHSGRTDEVVEEEEEEQAYGSEAGLSGAYRAASDDDLEAEPKPIGRGSTSSGRRRRRRGSRN